MHKKGSCDFFKTFWIIYDYVVINDNLENCFHKVENLIEAEINNGSKDYDKNFIKSHIDKLLL